MNRQAASVRYCTWVCCLSATLLAGQAVAALDLTPEEQAWLKAHPVLRVSSEPDYIPFDFRIAGSPAGYSVDYVRLVAARLGVRLEFVQDTWGNLLKKAEKRELDLVHSIFKSPKERERYLAFTKPYKEVLNAIIVREGTQAVRGLADLKQKTIALAKVKA
ncbi:transporter substrate-binding domain-containing protein, partial [Planctomycetota bacterium]